MSEDHDTYRDEIAASVLGALSEAEQQSLDRHLSGCESCSRDLERFRAVAETLPLTAPPRRAREDLKQEVLQRIRDSERAEGKRPAVRRRLFHRPAPRLPARALAGALAALALLAGGYGLGTALSGPEREVLVASVDSARAAGVSATLERRGDIGVLRASNLAPTEGVYVVWLDRGSGPEYASSFDVGPARVAEAGVSGLDGVQRMMVTPEATARVSRPTTRPVLTVELQ